MATRRSASMGRSVVFVMAVVAVGPWVVPERAAYGQTPGAAAPKQDKNAPADAPAAGAGRPAAPASSPSKASKESRATCEHYVAVFAGREKDPTVLKKPEVQAFASHAVDLVTCNAVRADSDEPCKVLEKMADGCKVTLSVFHEMRAYPNGRSYMFDDRKYEECKQSGGMPMVVCDALQKALRAGDADQCVMQADFAALCRKAVQEGNLEGVNAADCGTEGPKIRKMLEGQCRALVNLDPKACDVPGPHAEGMAEQCRKDIEGRKGYGKGLKQLAKSGGLPDREFAKAALDDPDACKELTAAAVDACVAASSAPKGAGDKGGADTAAPAPAKASPAAPEGAGAPED